MLWKSKIYLSVAWICVEKAQRLMISLNHPHGIHVHDGPGIHSDQMNNNTSVLYLSSWAAFIVVYTEGQSQHDIQIQHCGINYQAIDVDMINVHVNNDKALALPSCSAQTGKGQGERLKKSKESQSHYKGTEEQENLHCVYNITSEKGYTDFAIKRLTFLLHKSAEDVGNCPEGGVGFTRAYYNYLKNPRKFYCSNYTADIKVKSIYDKWILNIVSESRDGLIFVVYSFKYYSAVSIDATVTATPCRGVIYSGESIVFLLQTGQQSAASFCARFCFVTSLSLV